MHRSNQFIRATAFGEKAARPRVKRLLNQRHQIQMGDIKQIIHHLKAKGIGVLITDHNVRETLGICDRAYILNEGRVIAEGDPQVLIDGVPVAFEGHKTSCGASLISTVGNSGRG